MKFSLITDDTWPQKWTKIKRSSTAVGRHLKVKRQKDAQKAAEKAAAALAQQAEAS